MNSYNLRTHSAYFKINHETYLLFLSERGPVEKNHAFDLTYQFRLLITMICPRLISKEQVLRTCHATCKSRNKLMGIVTPFCVTWSVLFCWDRDDTTTLLNIQVSHVVVFSNILYWVQKKIALWLPVTVYIIKALHMDSDKSWI